MEYAGLDLHKSFCQIKICTKEGELIKEGRIKTETKDIEEFFSGLEDLKIAFEAGGNYEYFYDLLEGFGHKVVLAHPLKTKMIAEAKIKTDKIDAKTLAELLRGGFLPISYVPPKEVRALRHLVRRRIFLGRYRGIIKNQIKTELRRRNLKYQDGAGIFMGNEINASLVHFIFFSMQNENETRNRGKYKVYVYEHTRMTNHRTCS